MSAARLDFTETSAAGPCEQGSRFLFVVTYTGVNITGWTVRMQVRETAGDTATLLDISTATSGISLTTPASGIYTIDVGATDTAALPEGTWAYDLELVPDADEDLAFKQFRGLFQVVAEVTR